ncbi:MAG: acyl-CoA thioesterase [Gammaproteobacteria bacterium]|nr:acyl-CoA thioesterase [Gammaproteobacteria bacterium]
MSEVRASDETCEIMIRFPQVDPAGIVFYPRYFEMVQRCFPDVPFSRFPVGVKTQFLKPNRFGDRMKLNFGRGAEGDDWSVTGSMEDSTCFSMTPLDAGDAVACYQSSEAAAFSSQDSTVGEWCVDNHGRMHLSRYFEYLNMAIEEWFEDVLDLPFAELHVGRRIGIPTVQFDTQVFSLPGVGDEVAIRIRPIRAGGRAMTFASWLVSGGRCLVENIQVVVFVSMLDEGFESIDIPDYIRSAFQQQMTKAS